MGRGHIDLVGHNRFTFIEAMQAGQPITNITYTAKKPEETWIENCTIGIGNWRAKFRSCYIMWALAINGLHLATEKYADPDWQRTTVFTISSLRLAQGGLEPSIIAEWPGEKAAQSHSETINLLCSWALIDLYSCIEEFVFDFYRFFLDQFPETLLKGEEFRKLRQLRHQARSDPTAAKEWEAAWSERLFNWQRKRLYDGLADVFLAFLSHAGLKSSTYYSSNGEQWAETIGGIAELRNALVHGLQTVPEKLAIFSQKPNRMTFDFVQGEEIKLKLYHIQGVECFLDQLLTTLNMALLERAGAVGSSNN